MSNDTFRANQANNDIAAIVDASFLRFIKFITDILISKNEITIENRTLRDEINIVYKDSESSQNNIQFLLASIALFADVDSTAQHDLDELFYTGETYHEGRTRLFFDNPNLNLFSKCISSGLVIQKQLLLYTFIQVKLTPFYVAPRFYRQVRNLLINSSDRQIRTDNLRNLYLRIDKLIGIDINFGGEIFSNRQIEEEETKKTLIEGNPEFEQVIHKLEDHTLLRGSIGIFNIDDTIHNLGTVFLNKISTDTDFNILSKAMLSFGLYPKKYTRNRYRFGNTGRDKWREIFGQSESKDDFAKPKDVLNLYLSYRHTFPDRSNADIVNNYLNSEPSMDIRYYMMNYTWFQNGKEHDLFDPCETDGFYEWSDLTRRPYDCIMLLKTSFTGRSWSPFLLQVGSQVIGCSLGNYRDNLKCAIDNIKLEIRHFNEGFVFFAAENDQDSAEYLNGLVGLDNVGSGRRLTIPQDANGIDTIDRIKSCIDFLNRLLNQAV